LVARGIFQEISEAANFILCLAPYPELLNQFLVKILSSQETKEKFKPSTPGTEVLLHESVPSSITETIPDNDNDSLNSILSANLDTLFL
jgi:hypothetical protein